jgi:DNA-binding protein H-NS
MKDVTKLTGTDINKMSLKQIMELEAQIAVIKAEAVEQAREDVKSKIDAILEDSGFSISDLYSLRKQRRGTGVAKYVNPENRAQAWTGRGRKPNWLVTSLEAGASLADFEVR